MLVVLQIKFDTPVPLKPRVCRAGSVACEELHPIIVLLARLDGGWRLGLASAGKQKENKGPL